MPSSPELNIALIGCGTVGGGVVRILQSSADLLAQRTGRTICLRRIVVRDVKKRRNLELGQIPVSDDIRTVIDDPEIHAAIHVVGGVNPARRLCYTRMEVSCLHWLINSAAPFALKRPLPAASRLSVRSTQR